MRSAPRVGSTPANSGASPTGISVSAAIRCCKSSRPLAGQGFPLPHFQRRRRRGRAVRQRRALLRRVRARTGLTEKREIRVETAGGVIVPELEDDGHVTVDMGVPQFEPARIPFSAERRRRRSSPRRRRRAIEITRCRWAIRTQCRSSTTSTRAGEDPRPADRGACAVSRSA